jgi:hypothetical protein
MNPMKLASAAIFLSSSLSIISQPADATSLTISESYSLGTFQHAHNAPSSMVVTNTTIGTSNLGSVHPLNPLSEILTQFNTPVTGIVFVVAPPPAPDRQSFRSHSRFLMVGRMSASRLMPTISPTPAPISTIWLGLTLLHHRHPRKHPLLRSCTA